MGSELLLKIDTALECGMIIGSSLLRALSLLVVVSFALACDSGAPSKTRDDIAADSALASDLALANRDTMLVDSIGAYHPADAAERDTSKITIMPGKSATSGSATTKAAQVVPSKPAVVAAVPPAPPPSKPAVVPTAAPVAAAPETPVVAAGPSRRGSSACSSPNPADQQECVRATLPNVDMRLNRIYRALITETRRQERVANGANDPASVERLRVAQRAWLVYRDTECRKRGRGREGRLWARPRVQCLGEFSLRRANELADNFSRLTAH